MGRGAHADNATAPFPFLRLRFTFPVHLAARPSRMRRSMIVRYEPGGSARRAWAHMVSLSLADVTPELGSTRRTSARLSATQFRRSSDHIDPRHTTVNARRWFRMTGVSRRLRVVSHRQCSDDARAAVAPGHVRSTAPRRVMHTERHPRCFSCCETEAIGKGDRAAR
jgi:hypothetical protein